MTREFGGEWTDLKLDVMRGYFGAYAQALKYQPFECWYIDAFAGTGGRVERPQSTVSAGASLFGKEAKAVAEAKEGSVQIALAIEPPFRHYIFVDISKNHVARLNALRSEHPNRSIKVIPGDANEVLAKLCLETDWMRTRAAVFVDPYGMQVNWSTLERLAETKAVDLALLFPTGSLNRLLTRDGTIPESWVQRISDHLGPCDWRSAFYRTEMRANLFNTVASEEKNVNIAGLQTFVKSRLKEIFPYVHENTVPLKNSKGSVLYDLFIICANPSIKARSLVKRLANGAIAAATKARS